MINRLSFKKKSNKRSIFLPVLLSFIIILYKFYSIQISSYEKYKTKGSYNSLRKIDKRAPRGIIYDKNNKPLVDNRPTYSLSIIPFDAKYNFNYSLFNKLTKLDSNLLKIEIDEHDNKLSKFRELTIQNHIGFMQRSIIEEYKLEFPGIRFNAFPARTYPSNANLSHVLGYLRKITTNMLEADSNRNKYKIDDIIGFSGIEKVYEKVLKGQDGVEFHMVDIYGIDHGLLKTAHDYPAYSGNSMQLSIDIEMQELSEDLLNGHTGAIMLMNPKNGDVLALASAPDFDLGSFTGPIPLEFWKELSNNENNPLLNRSIQGLYPPGSIFKLLLLAFAIENNIIDYNWHIDCKGSMIYGDRTFNCWNENGHGSIDLVQSIQFSCNIFYYNLIQKVEFTDWTNFAKKFGFGNATGIDLPNEKNGIVPSKDYMNKRYGRSGWGKGSLLNFAIGQGDVLTTPIQILQIINLISTNGHTYKPRLNLRASHQVSKVNLSNKTWNALNKSIYEAVNSQYGTGFRAKNNIINSKIYGKTSTIQNPHGEPHSCFAGYIKLDNGKIMSLVVFIENGGKGSGLATQSANKLFKFYSENYN